MARIGFALLALLSLLAAACGQIAEQPASEPAATSPPAAVETDARVFCAEVARRVSARDCQDYVRLAESAERGAAAFNAPADMERGQTHVLQLAISYAPSPTPGTTEPDPAVSSSLTPAETVDPLPGETTEFAPLVGRFMRAELAGAGFAITPRSPASQEVTPDSVTTWTWDVVARRGGEQPLTLTTVVEGCVEGGGECVPLRSTTRNYTVNVDVSPIGRVRDFLTGVPDWIKLASAILAALAGLITATFAVRSAMRRGRRDT